MDTSLFTSCLPLTCRSHFAFFIFFTMFELPTVYLSSLRSLGFCTAPALISALLEVCYIDTLYCFLFSLILVLLYLLFRNTRNYILCQLIFNTCIIRPWFAFFIQFYILCELSANEAQVRSVRIKVGKILSSWASFALIQLPVGAMGVDGQSRRSLSRTGHSFWNVGNPQLYETRACCYIAVYLLWHILRTI